MEVGGLQRWAGPVEFLSGMLPGVKLLAPSLCWAKVGVVGGFWRKQWLWANKILGGAARMWVYLNSLDLNFLVCKMGSGTFTTGQNRSMHLAGLAQGSLGPQAGSHPPW